MSLNAIQSKVARVYLGWSRKDLALRAKVSLSSVNRLERGTRCPSSSTQNMRDAFEDNGIHFDDVRGTVSPYELPHG